MTQHREDLHVLLVDDDATFRKALSRALEKRGHRVDVAGGPEPALQHCDQETHEVALLDLKMPGMDGIELMQELRKRNNELQVVILTGHGSIPSAIEAIQAGAYHYLQKPCEVDEVELTLRNAARQRLLMQENVRLREAMQRATPFEGIVGQSAPMRALISLIERTNESWSPALIQGESGTGKELVARAMHTSSSRADRPFVTVNCAGLKPELLENELFGHVEGAFTGASRTKRGLFEVADGGTLFIDEVADMDLTVQASLLRVVETGVFRPLGSTREKQVQVRLVAAANRDLHAEVEAGRFRQDLLYRLEVVHIVVPPLRDRPEDVPLLVAHFLEQSREAREKEVSILPEAMNLLRSYRWPGNVRELFHVLERAALLSEGGPLGPRDVDAVLRPAFRTTPARSEPEPVTLEDSERRHIARMLEREGGNVSRVSEILDIDRRTLQRKMKRYGLR